MFSEEEFVLEEEPVMQAETGREKNGRFAKGYSGNPDGRPKKPEIDLLREALDKAKNKHGKDFLEHLVERAYESDTIAVALGKKILPDLRSVEASMAERPRITVEYVTGLASGEENEFIQQVIRALKAVLKQRKELDKSMENLPSCICTG